MSGGETPPLAIKDRHAPGVHNGMPSRSRLTFGDFVADLEYKPPLTEDEREAWINKEYPFNGSAARIKECQVAHQTSGPVNLQLVKIERRSHEKSAYIFKLMLNEQYVYFEIFDIKLLTAQRPKETGGRVSSYLFLPRFGRSLDTLLDHSDFNLIAPEPPKILRLPIETRLTIALDICLNLLGLHENQLAHLDLKPQNVTVEETLRARIIDMASATKAGTILTPMTKPRATNSHAAPEYHSREPFEVAVSMDLPSLAKILIELFPECGYTINIAGDNDIRVQEACSKNLDVQEFPPVAAPHPIRQLIDRLLSPEPTERGDTLMAVKAICNIIGTPLAHAVLQHAHLYCFLTREKLRLVKKDSDKVESYRSLSAAVLNRVIGFGDAPSAETLQAHIMTARVHAQTHQSSTYAAISRLFGRNPDTGRQRNLADETPFILAARLDTPAETYFHPWQAGAPPLTYHHFKQYIPFATTKGGTREGYHKIDGRFSRRALYMGSLIFHLRASSSSARGGTSIFLSGGECVRVKPAHLTCALPGMTSRPWGWVVKVLMAQKERVAKFGMTDEIQRLTANARDSQYFFSWFGETMLIAERNSAMEHPKVPAKYAEGYKLYEIMRNFGDHNLKQLMNSPRGADLTRKQRLNLVLGTAINLAVFHFHRFIHGDVKPENTMVQDQSVQIVDFGFVQEIGTPKNCSGTLKYMAPELLRDTSSLVASPAIDLFALAKLMIHVLREDCGYTFKPLPYKDKVISWLTGRLDADPDNIILKNTLPFLIENIKRFANTRKEIQDQIRLNARGVIGEPQGSKLWNAYVDYANQLHKDWQINTYQSISFPQPGEAPIPKIDALLSQMLSANPAKRGDIKQVVQTLCDVIDTEESNGIWAHFCLYEEVVNRKLAILHGVDEHRSLEKLSVTILRRMLYKEGSADISCDGFADLSAQWERLKAATETMCAVAPTLLVDSSGSTAFLAAVRVDSSGSSGESRNALAGAGPTSERAGYTADDSAKEKPYAGTIAGVVGDFDPLFT